MKKVLKLLLILALITSFSIVSFGCSGSTETNQEPATNDEVTQEVVTLEFWHTYSDTEEKLFNEQVIPLFEEKYPNIKIKSTRMPYEGLKQQVIAGAAGDAAPDLMRMDIIWVPEFAKLGALMPLNDQEGFNEIKGQLYEGPLATNYYDGTYYGLPLNTNTKVAIYNKELLAQAGLAEPPKTFDELIEASRALKADGKYGIGIGGTSAWGLLPYFWTFGGSVTDDNYTKATGYLNSPESIEALEKIIELNNEGLVAPSILGGEPGTWDGIKSEYLMIDDGPWFYSILGEDALNSTVTSTIPEGKGGSVSVVGGENIVIFNNTKHPNEAWTFMKFLMTEEPQIIMAQTGLVPTNVNAANSDEVLSVPFIKPYIEQLETAQPRTPHPNWGRIEESLNLAFEKAVRGEATAEEVLNTAAAEIDAFLQK